MKINAVLSLSLLTLSAFKLWSFSVTQRIASFGNIFVGACGRDDRPVHLLVVLITLVSRFASSVPLAYFLLWNDTLCCVYRCLNFNDFIRLKVN